MDSFPGVTGVTGVTRGRASKASNCVQEYVSEFTSGNGPAAPAQLEDRTLGSVTDAHRAFASGAECHTGREAEALFLQPLAAAP